MRHKGPHNANKLQAQFLQERLQIRPEIYQKGRQSNIECVTSHIVIGKMRLNIKRKSIQNDLLNTCDIYNIFLFKN